MLFSDLVEKEGKALEPEFERLFQLAIANQRHPGDIILIQENGSFDPTVLGFDGGRLNPHVIGPGRMGWSYFTHYQFINLYRQTQTAKVTHVEWLAKIAELVQAQNWGERDAHEDLEATSIHIETLIYIKIWESDYIIKILYEFVRLLEGKPYDWNFKILESSRDNNGTGTRQDIIRKSIRNRLERISPILYEALKRAYLTQLRNSVAHSNFSFQGDHMQLGNYIESDPHSQLRAISFSEWADKFHATLMIYNGVIGILNRAKEHNHAQLQLQGNVAEVLVTDKRAEEKTYTLPVVYDPDFRRFSYQQS
ncbi:hypothetical protein [Hymenobacter elongatus]|uniref:Apea-like HEPN domain-containing protein n=1 Tax=Hymenobacter elongatus TaxID=877208 RepID=A0A4Z0PJG4_9BACT|nr:hypothetical protein [Hymenobacter elongatus]TGE14993.1 hypothetical protein E5J99_13880 [Hymenobacter elongatus]